jgi:hypothetical protein
VHITRSDNVGGVAGIESDDGKKCVICLECPRQVRFQTCGHAVVCKLCLETLLRQATKRCPTCRTLLGNLSTSMSFSNHHARLETFLEEGEWEGQDAAVAYIEATSSDIPQCFSHFTYAFTEGRDLVCDLQGVWNAVDGFIFTDPVIHHNSHKSGRVDGHNGRTDKGLDGIRKFFVTHKCNSMCRRLGLEVPTLSL